MRHLTLRGNTYHYRRRIPSKLNPYININFFYKALSKDIKLSEMLATRIDTIFDELLAMEQLGIEPKITKLGLSKPEKVSPLDSYLNAIERSADSQKTTSMHINVLSVLMPKEVQTVNYDLIDTLVTNIKRLPKRNIQKYKKIPIQELIKMDIPKHDRLGERGINSYLKTLKSYLNFCYKRKYINIQFDIPLVKRSLGSREERKALHIDTIYRLINGSKAVELQSIYTLLYLSGMRLSEAYKCKITIVDGCKCFDLIDKSVKLKTQNSYRLIPIHKSITNPEMILESLRSINPDYIIKHCTKNLNDGTLYSLRHSFATHLASNAIEPHLISELMGHKHETMTLSRYIKGFPVKMLKDAIDTLAWFSH